MTTKPSEYRFRISRDSVERMFLRWRMHLDAQEFTAKGDQFVVGLVSPDARWTFDKAVNELVRIGCRRDVLFRCPFRLWYAKKHPPTFPDRKEVVAVGKKCRELTKTIRAWEKMGVVEALRLHIPPPPALESELLYRSFRDVFSEHETPPGFVEPDPTQVPIELAQIARQRISAAPYTLANLLLWYSELMKSWWAPRKDIVRSYARVACYVYPSIATAGYGDGVGSWHFDRMADLLDAFENTIDAKGSADLYAKNLRNVELRFPQPYQEIVDALRQEHLGAASAK